MTFCSSLCCFASPMAKLSCASCFLLGSTLVPLTDTSPGLKPVKWQPWQFGFSPGKICQCGYKGIKAGIDWVSRLCQDSLSVCLWLSANINSISFHSQRYSGPDRSPFSRGSAFLFYFSAIVGKYFLVLFCVFFPSSVYFKEHLFNTLNRCKMWNTRKIETRPYYQGISLEHFFLFSLFW